jgi:hypothetical protein
MTESALDLVQRFCDAFGKGATPTELVDYFADDAVYHNIPWSPRSVAKRSSDYSTCS